jgi:hypothetical protein
MELSWHGDIDKYIYFDKDHSYALAGVSQMINK